MEEQASPCRIPIVDDHAFIREGTRTALAAVDGLGMVGGAEDGHRALGTFQREEAMWRLRNGPCGAYAGLLGRRSCRTRVPPGQACFLPETRRRGGIGSCAVKTLA